MRTIKAKQTRIIVGNTPEDFEAKLNACLTELAFNGCNHEITFNLNAGYCAYVVYTNTSYFAETVEDEYELEGEKFTCGNCKYLPTPKDKRIKNVHCQFNGKLRDKCSHACEEFYKSLEQAETFLKDEDENKA